MHNLFYVCASFRVEQIMFRRKHAPEFNSNDAEQRKAKVSLKNFISS